MQDEWEMTRIQIPIRINVGDQSETISYIRKNILINGRILSEFSLGGMAKIISILFGVHCIPMEPE